ncbi:MAG: hypothetical protein KDK91_31770, partial [Gammaproteobacteria bacterium]|nr:hypothetical protein [Gammaproteobacteria bacterium]
MTPSAATATPTRLRRAQRHADRNTRRWQRWPRLLLTLGCCLLALWPATRGEALSISGFKNDLVEFLLEQVSVPGEFEIRAGRIEQLESGGTVLEEVRIIDSQGVWFTAARFDFSWSPSRLLRGEVQIDHLNLVGGRLNRLPVAKPAPSESTRAADTPARGDWPRSPIALLIKRVSIRDMQVSDSVLPQRLGFDANGALRDDGNEQSLQLDLTRTDTVAGRIDLSYTRRFEPDALQLQIGANEAPAGLVATLLGLPNDVPVDLQLQADGPPSAWGGDLSLAGEGLLGAHGQFEAAWAERIRARFDLDLSPGPRLAAGVRGAIGEQARLRFTALEHDDGRVVVETARIDSAGLQARASGYLDRTARTLDLDLQVESDGQSATRLARLTEPLRFANANLRVRVSGAMDDPRIEARGELGRPLASGFGASRASIDLQARAGADATTLTLDAALHEPFGPTPEVARALGPQLRLSLDGRREADTIRLASLRLDARGLGFSADGSLRLGEVLTPDLNYALRLDTLSPWAGSAGLAARGSVRGSGRLTPLRDRDGFSASGTLQLRELVVNDARLGEVDLAHALNVTDALAGTAELRMRSPQFGPGHATAGFQGSGRALRVERLDARLLGLQARGQVALSQASPTASPIERADLQL